MALSEIQRMISLLAARTRGGNVPWQETDHEGVYQASFSNGSVQILMVEGDGGRDALLRVFNEEGSLVEEIRDPDIAVGDMDEGGAYEMMKETFEIARRHALGLDKVIDGLIEDLQDKEVPF